MRKRVLLAALGGLILAALIGAVLWLGDPERPHRALLDAIRPGMPADKVKALLGPGVIASPYNPQPDGRVILLQEMWSVSGGVIIVDYGEGARVQVRRFVPDRPPFLDRFRARVGL